MPLKDLFQEKKEYYFKQFRYKSGWFDFILGGLIWGFIIVNFTNEIFGFIYNNLSFISITILRQAAGFLVFGIVLAPLELLLTYSLMKLYDKIFTGDIKIV